MTPKARDVITFFFGLAGMAHQTFVASQPQPILVGAFVLMMGGSAAMAKLADRFGG